MNHLIAIIIIKKSSVPKEKNRTYAEKINMTTLEAMKESIILMTSTKRRLCIP
jgi:hypothetical protein